MNPAIVSGVLTASAIVSGVLTNLWLYWTATFVGTSIVALLVRKKYTQQQ
jgi:aquaporin Z